MAKAKKYYIGERVNPQLSNPYFVAYGQLTAKDAASKTDCAYGYMYITSYDTVEEYDTELMRLKTEGFRISIR